MNLHSLLGNTIARKITIYVVFLSLFAVLVGTGLQLYLTYRQNMRQVYATLALIEASYLDSLVDSIWVYNDKQVRILLDGMLGLSGVEYVYISKEGTNSWSSGAIKSNSIIEKKLPLIYRGGNNHERLGTLYIVVGLDNVYRSLIAGTLFALVISTIVIFLTAGVILFIFRPLVTRHMTTIAHFVNNIDMAKEETTLKLQRPSLTGRKADELDQVVNAINNMGMNLRESIAKLKYSEARYRSLIENQTDLVCRFTPDGTFSFVNDVYCELFNISKKEIIGSKWKSLLVDDDVEFINEKLSVSLYKNPTAVIESRVRSGAGEIRWMHFNNSGIFDSQGNLLEIQSVGRDITDRKYAEEKERASRGFLVNILNNIGDPVFVKDDQHRLTVVNNAFCSTFGKPRGEIIGKTLVEDVPPNEQDHFLKIDRQVIRDGKENVCEETLTVQGSKSLTILTKKSLYVADNGEKFLVGVIRDITERKEAEEERNKLTTQLHQSQKMESIGNLAGGIAHEFNNMLAIIMGNNELIMEELPQGSLARESSEEIRIAGIRARDVVKQLLTFSRQDDAIKKVMDLTSIVQESMKLLRSSIPVNIKIEQSLSADTYSIMGNGTQINQLIINLCNNAVDALPENGGRITIELLNETIEIQQTKNQTKLNPGQYAKLIVSDNGMGMDTEILDRVFEPYFTTKNVGEGTGIGMAVVHGIVERHGGAIIADSKPGRGSAFTIFLPAYDGPPEQETDEQDILPIGDEYILYVDDETSIAKIGKRLLGGLGYRADSTTDPEKALAMVRKDPNKFDLLITDMAMPNMTGDQLVIEILKIRQDMPTIICTGYSAKISEKEAANIGVRSFIMKPINKSELATTVRKVLDGAKADNLENS